MATTKTTQSTNQRTRAATESLAFLAISAGILIGLNVIFAVAPPIRFDWTGDDLFSLSDGSKRLAGSLTDKLEITAYFTEDLPPPFNATERYVRDILSEYQSASGGKIVITYVNPDTEDEKEEAEEAGIQRVSHQAIKDDSVQVVEGYRGLVMRYLDQTEVLPVIQDTSGLEYAISMKLKKMVGERRPIGVVSGHEGPTLEQGLGRLRTCAPMYEFREVSAASAIEVGDDEGEVAAMLLVEPGNELSEAELTNLNTFVMNGGSLGVFGGSMKVALEGQAPAATTVSSGVNTLLRPWGVVIEDGIVMDAQCGRAPLRTPIGMIPVPHPPVPLLTFDEAQREHPVLYRLDSSPFPFTSAVTLNDSAEHATVLARSSENSWLEDAASINLAPRDPRQWTEGGDSGPFPVIVALEGKLPTAFEGAEPAEATTDVHVLVAGGSFFMRDEALPQGDAGGECELSSNLALALNALDWLSQDSDLIAIRAKNVEEPPIEVPLDVRQAEDEARDATSEALEAAQQGSEEGVESAVREREAAMERRKDAMESWESKKKAYRFGNMLGIPFAFALFGVGRWYMRKQRRANMKL